MRVPCLADTEKNLRNCLLLKADDIYFTLGEHRGGPSRDGFLGIQVVGLAQENLSEAEIASIDLDQVAIAQQVRALHAMLEGRRLSLHNQYRPDVEVGRHDALEFLEHFLSTLPNVALGGLDLTAAGNGEVRRVYELAYAWLNLIETIEAAFFGETDSVLTVNDLALLSGLETRTLRNRCGPGKLIRTSSTRTAQQRGAAAPAFVSLNAFDALDWLRGRQDFTISQIDPDWIVRRLSGAKPADAVRGLLVASIINLGAMSDLAPTLGFSPNQARDWFDRGVALPRDIGELLTNKLEIAN